MENDLEHRFIQKLGLFTEWYVGTEQFSFDDAGPIGFLINCQEACKCWKASAEICESPIERLLLSELLFDYWSLNDISHMHRWSRMPYVTRWNGDLSEFQGAYFDMQAPVGDFRADFLFTCVVKGNIRRIAVECDGHDFHERTKEQARRDRRRDRTFQYTGTPVLRFTGSELHRDVSACCLEISEFISKTMAEMGFTRQTAVLNGELVGIQQ